MQGIMNRVKEIALYPGVSKMEHIEGRKRISRKQYKPEPTSHIHKARTVISWVVEGKCAIGEPENAPNWLGTG